MNQVNNIAVGDLHVVLVSEEVTPRNLWPFARVKDVNYMVKMVWLGQSN